MTTPATTTIKVTALDHQTLIAFLRLNAGQITDNEFKTIMISQGRSVSEMEDEDLQQMIAESLIRPFS